MKKQLLNFTLIKSITKMVLPLLLISASVEVKGQCAVAVAPPINFGCTSGDAIDAFMLNGSSSAITTGCSPGSYGYSPVSTWTLQMGVTNNWTASVGGGTWSEGFGIWIDLNQDGFYSLSELIATSPSAPSHSGSFVIPISALTGTTTMRTRCTYGGSIPLTATSACDMYSFGETEEFVINISCPATAPIITASASSNTICPASSVTLTANGLSSYTWTPGAVSGASIVVTPTTTTTYTVMASIAGCNLIPNSIATKTIFVSAPTLTVNSGAICNGVGSFTMIPGGASSYTYSSGSAVVTPTVSSTYTVAGVYAAGCLATVISTVDVGVSPTIFVTSGLICLGQSFVMVASGASTYTYSGGSAVVTPSTNTSYSVTGTSAIGCVSSNTAVSSVTVNPTPAATISASASRSIICVGETAVLTVSTSATSYTWNTGASTISISVSPTVTTLYTVSGVNTVGCTSVANLYVTVNACTGINEQTASLISVYPNPNNGIVNISLTAELAQNSTLEIYDAIGKLVVKQVLASELNAVNISNLENGIYMFKVLKNNNTVKIGKLIKQ